MVAVPEGLPMSVTLSLALNMRRMLSTNNLVRKMHACETMGAITVICTDKTGTLTQNLMQIYEPSFYGLKNGGEVGEDDISKLVIEGISTNSTAFLEEIAEGEKPKGVGNPTEVALLFSLCLLLHTVHQQLNAGYEKPFLHGIFPIFQSNQGTVFFVSADFFKIINTHR